MDEDSKGLHTFTSRYLPWTFKVFTSTGDRSIRTFNNSDGGLSIVGVDAPYAMVQADEDDFFNRAGGATPGYPIKPQINSVNQYPTDTLQSNPPDNIAGYLMYSWYPTRGAYMRDATNTDDIQNLLGDASEKYKTMYLQYSGWSVYKHTSWYVRGHTGAATDHNSTYYKNVQFVDKQPLADLVHVSHGGEESDRSMALNKIRAMHMMVPMPGAPNSLFNDFKRKITYVATGLPYFTNAGFIGTDSDFSYLEVMRTTGLRSDHEEPYPWFHGPDMWGPGDLWETPTAGASGEGGVGRAPIELWADSGLISTNPRDKLNIAKWISDVPIGYNNVPCGQAWEDFSAYFRGSLLSDTRFMITEESIEDLIEDLEIDTLLGEGTREGSPVIDRRLNYSMDPSSVPFVSFDIHYSNEICGINSTAAGNASTARTHMATTAHFLDHALPLIPDLQYNLENCDLGRLPPVFAFKPGRPSYQSNVNMEDAGGGDLGYTTAVPDPNARERIRANIGHKMHSPRAKDGAQKSFFYSKPSAINKYYDYIDDADTSTFPGNITEEPPEDALSHDNRITHQTFLEDGIYWMRWQSQTHLDNRASEAMQRHRNSLGLFLGTEEFNLFNALKIIKKRVEALADTWAYDDSPAETRIRMQRAARFENSQFTSIGSELTDTAYEEGSISVVLENDIAPDLGTEILPDDIDDIGRAVFGDSGDTDSGY